MLTETRAAAKQAKHHKQQAPDPSRGDFGERLKDHLSLRGLRLGKNACDMAAKLVEGEVGAGPLFEDVVRDEDRRAAFRDFIRDRIERSPARGIEGAYRDVKEARWGFLTGEAQARLIAKAAARPRPDHVAKYLDLLKAFTRAPVFDAEGQPVLAGDLSPEDEDDLIGLREAGLGRLAELIRAYPPIGASRARLRARALLLAAHLAGPPASGGAAQSPRPGAPHGVTEKARTGAANRSILRFSESWEAPLRELVGDAGQTRQQSDHFASADHAASVFSPSLALWAIHAYASPGDLVLDPFAGGGTRAVMAALSGLRYVGTELRADQADLVNARLRHLSLDHRAVVYAADAASFDWLSAVGDDRARLVVTCPPYHQLERYSDHPADLSNCPSYDEFCAGLRRVIDALRPALAPGADSVWVAGEVRDSGTNRMLRIPEDVRSIHEAAGFDPFERNIPYARNQRPRSEGQEARRGRVVSVNEFVVVTRYGQRAVSSDTTAHAPPTVRLPGSFKRVDLVAALKPLPAHFVHEDATLTPIESHRGILVKREDLFVVQGARGSKAREALALLDETDAPGLIGYGNKRSTTAVGIAAAARERGARAIFHTGSKNSDEMRAAEALGCEVVVAQIGYLNVLRKRALDDAQARGWPCGLEHEACVHSVAAEVLSLVGRDDVARIVIASGGCVVLAGLLVGLRAFSLALPVLAVTVGAALNEALLDRYAPHWRAVVATEAAQQAYERPALETRLGDLELDPLYEAKTIPYLKEGDLLWNSGIRTQ